MEKKRIKIVRDIDPNDVSKTKAHKKRSSTKNVKDFEEDHTGDDLDIPGVELDDDLEEIGSEDEENNYYSLGGDRHANLEEHDG